MPAAPRAASSASSYVRVLADGAGAQSRLDRSVATTSATSTQCIDTSVGLGRIRAEGGPRSLKRGLGNAPRAPDGEPAARRVGGSVVGACIIAAHCMPNGAPWGLSSCPRPTCKSSARPGPSLSPSSSGVRPFCIRQVPQPPAARCEAPPERAHSDMAGRVRPALRPPGVPPGNKEHGTPTSRSRPPVHRKSDGRTSCARNTRPGDPIRILVLPPARSYHMQEAIRLLHHRKLLSATLTRALPSYRPRSVHARATSQPREVLPPSCPPL